MHRDISSDNILVSIVNHKPYPVLADLGLSRDVADPLRGPETLTLRRGNRFWCAPEVSAGEPYTFSADIFSLALVLWEIFTQETPHQDSPSETERAITEGKRPSLAKITGSSKKAIRLLRQLIADMWRAIPEQRPDIHSVKAALQAIRERFCPKTELPARFRHPDDHTRFRQRSLSLASASSPSLSSSSSSPSLSMASASLPSFSVSSPALNARTTLALSTSSLSALSSTPTCSPLRPVASPSLKKGPKKSPKGPKGLRKALRNARDLKKQRAAKAHQLSIAKARAAKHGAHSLS